MRVLAALLGVALATACGAAAQDETGVARTPRLEIVRLAPLTVRGTGFRPGERVRVLATAAGVETRRVFATASGAFRVRLRLKASSCTALVVQAIGAAGSRATIDRPTPDCAEP